MTQIYTRSTEVSEYNELVRKILGAAYSHPNWPSSRQISVEVGVETQFDQTYPQRTIMVAVQDTPPATSGNRDAWLNSAIGDVTYGLLHLSSTVDPLPASWAPEDSLLWIYDRDAYSVSVAATGGGGGGGPELDPSVIRPLNNMGGTSLGNIRGTAVAQVVVSSSDLGTTFDYNVTEAGKVAVKTMVAATPLAAGVKGLVPAPAAGDHLKFLRGDATWAAAGNVPLLTAGTSYGIGDLYRYNNDLYMVHTLHVGAATPTVANIVRMDRFPVLQTITSSSTATKDAGIIRATGGVAQIITLPVVSAADDGLLISVKAANTQVGGVTLNAGAGNTVDGAASMALNPSDAVILQVSGTVWNVLSKPASAASAMTASTNVAPGTSGSTPTNAAGTHRAFLRGDATWAYSVPSYSAGVDYKAGEAFIDTNGVYYVVVAPFTSAAIVDASKVYAYPSTQINTSAAALVGLSAREQMIVLTGAVAQTVTLPALSTPNTDGLVLTIKVATTQVGGVTVNRTGADTIDAGTTFALAAGEALVIIGQGTVWRIISRPASAGAGMTAATNVAAGTVGSTPTNAAGTHRAFLRGDATWAYSAPAYASGVDYKVGEEFVDTNGDLYVVTTAHNSAATINLANVSKFARIDSIVTSALASYTMTGRQQMLVATGVAAQTITLPTIGALDAGFRVVVKADAAQVGGVTVQRAATDTIDGANTTTITPGQAIILESDGAGKWYIIAKMSSGGSVMTAATNAVAGVGGSTPTNIAGTQRAFLRGDATWAYAAPAHASGVDYKAGELVKDSLNFVWLVIANHTSAAADPVQGVNTIRIGRHPEYIGTAGVAVTIPTHPAVVLFTGAGGCTATMPLGSTSPSGTIYTFRTATFATSNMTIARTGGIDAFDGTTSTTSLTVAPGEAYILQSTGSPTWLVLGKFSSSAVTAMTAATNAVAGTAGGTVLNAAGTQFHFLRGDATWAAPINNFTAASDYKTNVLVADQNIVYRASANHLAGATPDGNLSAFSAYGPIRIVTTAAYTPLANDRTIICNGGVPQTITLPVGSAALNGLTLTITRHKSNTNLVTVNRGGANTIDDGVLTTFTLSTAGDSVTLHYDHSTTQWYQVWEKKTSSGLTLKSFTSTHSAVTGAPTATAGLPAGWSTVISANDIQITHAESDLPKLYSIVATIAAADTIIVPGTAFRIRKVSATRMDLISATNGVLGGTNGSGITWKFFY